MIPLLLALAFAAQAEVHPNRVVNGGVFSVDQGSRKIVIGTARDGSIIVGVTDETKIFQRGHPEMMALTLAQVAKMREDSDRLKAVVIGQNAAGREHTITAMTIMVYVEEKTDPSPPKKDQDPKGP